MYFPPGIKLKISSTNASPPTPLKIKENIDAPIKILKIIVVTVAVLTLVSFRSFKSNLPFSIAIKIAPRAPTPAASVGVAIPAMIDPSTTNISNIGGSSVINMLIS